ncbi:MAG: general secretion pathway protein GspK [Pirellulales bacterium]|nr:general secretion pathway protein GspK [Pirellulales bacterium]
MTRRAMVLVLVLIVVAMISLGAYSFSELMFAEYRGARLHERRLQARLAAESAVEYAAARLARTLEDERQATPTAPLDPWRGVLVYESDDPAARARFAVVAPPVAGDETFKLRFGLGNESAKLNLRTLLDWDRQQPGAAQAALMRLPGMREELADALLDWIDEDNVPRPQGAEAEHYQSLEPAYLPANRPPASLAELLPVRGMTRALLFGDDANRNGYLETVELDTARRRSEGTIEESTPFGWATYLTVSSAEGNLAPNGRPRIDVNRPELQLLFDDLVATCDESWATFIVAYRQFGPYLGPAASGALQSAGLDFTTPAKFRIASLLDLIAVRVQIPSAGSRAAVVLACPFENNRDMTRQYLPKLFDWLTTTPPTARTVGRVNVNLACREVLSAVPKLDPVLVEEILSKRGAEAALSPDRRHISWLLVEGLVELEPFKALLPYVTTGGDVHAAQVVGFLDQRGPLARAEVLLDATRRPVRLLSWTDLTPLGRGFDAELLGAEPAGSGR